MTSSFNSIHHAEEYSLNFCRKFLSTTKKKYILGCNAWAASIARVVKIDGFIDDFINATEYCGKPVFKKGAIEEPSMIISAVVGERPLTALNNANAIANAEVLDYFSFQRYSGLDLFQVMFLGDFDYEYGKHSDQYEWLLKRLKDDESKRTLQCLINFRLSRDLLHMHGFENKQDRQYFEPFLNLANEGESFVDVGCFDGFTTAEFIRYCPNYDSIQVFEPDPSNMERVKSKLGSSRNINYHAFGASNREAVLTFEAGGSASRFSESGKLSIQVRRIDHMINEPFTFLKMDIEGGELEALEGARESINKYYPRLAVSVYHKPDDLRKVPNLILSYRDDYDLYLKHYTEGVTETVMFFIPNKNEY